MLQTYIRYDRKHRPLGESPEEVRKRDTFDRLMNGISDALPAIIAEALTVYDNPDGTLRADDIGIEVNPSGPFDRNIIDLSIIILANDYAERRENLEERKRIIEARLRQILPDWWTTSIWIFLGHGEYVLIPGQRLLT